VTVAHFDADGMSTLCKRDAGPDEKAMSIESARTRALFRQFASSVLLHRSNRCSFLNMEEHSERRHYCFGRLREGASYKNWQSAVITSNGCLTRRTAASQHPRRQSGDMRCSADDPSSSCRRLAAVVGAESLMRRPKMQGSSISLA
jgi:hypothetical protein